MKKLYLSCLFALLCVGFASAQELKDSFEVYFEFNKAILKKESIETIDTFLAKTKGRRLGIRVAGHTCDIGTDDYNLKLSEDRTNAAFEHMKSVGEPEDKVELFHYGEKELKYGAGGVKENRRVFILFTLEDDDRDTLLKADCLEIFVEKGTYKPNKNKNIQFEYKALMKAGDVKMAGIKMEDENGKRYYANGIAYYSAKVNGAEVDPGKSVKVKLPAVGPDEEGFMLYTGVKSGSNIIWKATGRPCGAAQKEGECNTYSFDWQGSGYCGCLKPRACEEDCSDNPFGGERSPDLKSADIRYSGAKTVAKFPNDMYKSPLADMKVDIIDDTKLEEDCDICEQFKYGIDTYEWFPNFWTVKSKQNIIIKAKDASGNAAAGDPNKTLRVMVPRDKVKDMENPILLPGTYHSKGYMKWDKAQYEQTKCLGPINCDFVVFDVPASGNYKLGEVVTGGDNAKKDAYILKTRVLKNSVILVGDKSNGFVYKAKNASKGDKQREKEYLLHEAKDMNKLVLLMKNDTNGKLRYAEFTLSECKYKANKKMYILRKSATSKVKDFNEMTLSKCK